MTDQLGEDFFASDVEGLLLEHGLLPSKVMIMIMIMTMIIMMIMIRRICRS